MERRGRGRSGAGGVYLSSPGPSPACPVPLPVMALRRISWVLRAPLSTTPATREQPAAGPEVVAGRGPKAAPRPPPPPLPAVDFGNTQEAYRSRRSWELARSLLVLRLCASPALLAHHEQVRGGREIGVSRGFRGAKEARSLQLRKRSVSCTVFPAS